MSDHDEVPAWRRATAGELRWQVDLAVILAVAMQATLTARVNFGPRWLLAALAVALVVGLNAGDPRHVNRNSRLLRGLSLALLAVIAVGNAWSDGRLINGLVNHSHQWDSATLLRTGAAIWLTNVIVFALLYWDFDRGGPVARSLGSREHPDFLFAQMQNPELAPADWEPRFLDYFYTSFTNATAFSPTDVLPLSAWAKISMMAQSAISLTTVALVIARAVNVLS